jgi:ABC-type multidrug transport system permease subunit
MKKFLFTALIPLTTIAGALAQVNIQLGGSGSQFGTAGVNSTGGQTIIGLMNLAQTIVVKAVPLLIGLAVVIFFGFLIKYIVQGSQDSTKRDESIKGMAFSVVALFVMVSIWGIIGLFGSFFGIGQGGSVPTPGIPIPQ